MAVLYEIEPVFCSLPYFSATNITEISIVSVTPQLGVHKRISPRVGIEIDNIVSHYYVDGRGDQHPDTRGNLSQLQNYAFNPNKKWDSDIF
jgi:hypothetical protein